MKNKGVKSLVISLLVASMLFSNSLYAIDEESTSFIDVVGHWAEDDINKLRELKITEGKPGNYFGIGEAITRAEFTTFLVRLMKWNDFENEVTDDSIGSFNDNKDKSKWYFNYIEAAVNHGIVDNSHESFRPLDNITRIEIVEMIVNTLGFRWHAEDNSNQKTRFEDVTTQLGYIELLADFGIINGKSKTSFDPYGDAKREEAAVILIRMYNLLEPESIELNGFYAIKSYGQSELIAEFNQISFGWAELKFEEDNETISFKEDFPDQFEIPLGISEDTSGNKMISIYGSNESQNKQGIGIVDLLLKSEDNRLKVIEEIMLFLETYDSFDGVTIDFENIWNNESKDGLNVFVQDLSIKLKVAGKKLTVMVQPLENYNYDYRTIGEYADQVILMAHDYQATSLNMAEVNSGWVKTPLTPFDKVYQALKDITDEVTGVEDLNKISLQFSMDAVQWGVNDTGSVNNVNAYRPLYDSLYSRLIQEDVNITFGRTSRNPFAEYYNEEVDLSYTIWYEDSRSIEEKIKLAKLFGIHNFSVWRIGNIPDFADIGDKKVYLDIMETFRNLSE